MVGVHTNKFEMKKYGDNRWKFKSPSSDGRKIRNWQYIPYRKQLHKLFKTGQSQHTLRKALGNVKLCLDYLPK